MHLLMCVYGMYLLIIIALKIMTSAWFLFLLVPFSHSFEIQIIHSPLKRHLIRCLSYMIVYVCVSVGVRAYEIEYTYNVPATVC